MISTAKSFIKNYLFTRKAYRFFMRDWIALSDIPHASDVLATMRFSQNLKQTQQEVPAGKRILVIAPHPDDETIGPGGTLLKALKEGATVLTLYLTCGTPSTENQLRIEARDIASKAGYDIVFLDHYSKNIRLTDDAVTGFSEIINQFSPDVVFIPFFLDDHDDHRRASQLLLQANAKHLLKKHFEIWAYQVYTTVLPNVVVDITDVAVEKENLINMWKTQNTTRNWAHYALGLNAFNQRFLPNGPKPKYAETFFVLPLKEYLEYCRQYFVNPADCYYHSGYKNE